MTSATKLRSHARDAKALKRIFSGDAVVGYAVLGCLVAVTIGIVKAIGMTNAGAAACLLAPVAAVGTVCCLHFCKS